MKQTLIFSLTLVVLLNVWQFMASYSQREAAFAPAWALAASDGSAHGATVVARPAAETPTAGAAVATGDAGSVATSGGAAASAPVDPATAAGARLGAAGLRPDFAALYLSVQVHTGTPWQLLAAVHEVETSQSGSTSRASYAGAVGPMQFMPATFRAWAVDGDGDGAAVITDLNDAMMTAGRYLAAGGADKGNYSTALYHYNHSESYMSRVLGIARRLGL